MDQNEIYEWIKNQLGIQKELQEKFEYLDIFGVTKQDLLYFLVENFDAFNNNIHYHEIFEKIFCEIVNYKKNLCKKEEDLVIQNFVSILEKISQIDLKFIQQDYSNQPEDFLKNITEEKKNELNKKIGAIKDPIARIIYCCIKYDIKPLFEVIAKLSTFIPNFYFQSYRNVYKYNKIKKKTNLAWMNKKDKNLKLATDIKPKLLKEHIKSFVRPKSHIVARNWTEDNLALLKQYLEPLANRGIKNENKSSEFLKEKMMAFLNIQCYLDDRNWIAENLRLLQEHLKTLNGEASFLKEYLELLNENLELLQENLELLKQYLISFFNQGSIEANWTKENLILLKKYLMFFDEPQNYLQNKGWSKKEIKFLTPFFLIEQLYLYDQKWVEKNTELFQEKYEKWKKNLELMGKNLKLLKKYFSNIIKNKIDIRAKESLNILENYLISFSSIQIHLINENLVNKVRLLSKTNLKPSEKKLKFPKRIMALIEEEFLSKKEPELSEKKFHLLETIINFLEESNFSKNKLEWLKDILESEKEKLELSEKILVFLEEDINALDIKFESLEEIQFSEEILEMQQENLESSINYLASLWNAEFNTNKKLDLKKILMSQIDKVVQSDEKWTQKDLELLVENLGFLLGIQSDAALPTQTIVNWMKEQDNKNLLKEVFNALPDCNHAIKIPTHTFFMKKENKYVEIKENALYFACRKANNNTYFTTLITYFSLTKNDNMLEGRVKESASVSPILKDADSLVLENHQKVQKTALYGNTKNSHLLNSRF